MPALLNDAGANVPYQVEQADAGGYAGWNPNGRDAVTVHGGALPRYQVAPAVAGAVAGGGSAQLPGAPTLRGVLPGLSKGSVSVTFWAPASNGGSGVTGYVVVDESNGVRFKASGSPATVTGLVSGKTQSFAVAAVNGVGQGMCSEVSSGVVVP